jgi:FkbM family methyltransferase
MKNYSQSQEQQAILNYFGDFKGSFLSLGENDGETLSNVRALALLGWCGAMVEPAPIAFSKLKSIYDKDKKGCFYVYNCAIGNQNGKAILYDSGSLLKTGDTSLVSTLVSEEKKRFQSVLNYTDVEVKVYRWKTFFNRLQIKKFDFVSIDCEGVDADILEQMDMELLGVKCLCIEWNGHNELKELYTKKMLGYNIIYTSGENLIFAK